MSEEQDRKDYAEYVAYVKRQQAKSRSMQNIAEDEKKYSAASDRAGENFTAGVGAGLVGVGDRAVNLLLPKSLERGRFTSEAIAEKNRLEKDLLDTGAGSAGKFAGELVATLPVGGAAGLAAKGAAGASRAASAARLVNALRTPTGYGARAASAALEGAGQSALTSDPGEGLKEAGIGAALGAGMGAGGKLLGRAARMARPEITPEARALMKETGGFIPASHALPKGGLARMGYEGVLSNLPVSGQAIRGQREAAVGSVREKLMEKAVPHGTSPEAIFQHGDTMKSSFNVLNDVWDKAYDDVYKAEVKNVKLPQSVTDIIQERSGGTVKHTGDLTGREMLDLTQSLQELINETPKGPLARAGRERLQNLKKVLETKLVNSLPKDVAEGFEKNKSAYKTYLALKKAGGAAPGMEYSLRGAERNLAKKGAAGEDLALRGMQTLPDFPSRQGIFQMAAAAGTVGGAGGVVGWKNTDQDADLLTKLRNAGLGVGAAMLGAKFLSSQAGQKLVAQYGEQGALDKYAEALAKAGKVGRAGVQVGKEQ